MNNFALKLKELREKAGLTQKELGERAGMHPLTIGKLEQGIRMPGWETVLALAEALGLSCEDFAEKAKPRKAAKPGRPIKGKVKPKK